MPVMCVARQFASLGEELAREIESSSGYTYVDKAALERDLASFGIEGPKRERFEERKPGFIASLSQERDDYIHFLRTVTIRRALAGNVIFVGRGCGAILRGIPSALRAKTVCPLELRVDRAAAELGLDKKRARQVVEQADMDRRGFHRYFFQVDWDSSESYDLVINTGSLGLKEAASLMLRAVDIMVSPEREKAGRAKLVDLSLSQDIVTKVLYDKKLPVHFLEARVLDGKATLHGVTSSRSVIESALVAAKEVPGVAQADSEIQIVQEYSVLP
jgi:cytidylate kinase